MVGVNWALCILGQLGRFPGVPVTHDWKGHPETHPPGDVILVQSEEFQVKKPRGSLFAGVILEFDVPGSRDSPQPGKCQREPVNGYLLGLHQDENSLCY